MPPVVIVHGGAGAWDDSRLPSAVEVCEEAAMAGADVLSSGALQAVVAAVRVLEENPSFNAGVGSTLTREGTIELDAAVMTGDLRFGAVAACPPLESAILAALALHADRETSILVGEAALRFAVSNGVMPVDPEKLKVERVLEHWRKENEARSRGESTVGSGTVGAVACDDLGRLAAATSTGGILWKRAGRVGDTPLPGAGTYANEHLGGAASATGQGEAILRVLLCREAVDQLGKGVAVEQATGAALEILSSKTSGRGGVIVVDHTGNFFANRNTKAMPWAACSHRAKPVSGF